jgi:acetyl-CoA synthetase
MNEGFKIQDGQYNIGYICTGQQCARGRSNKIAMRFINHANLERSDSTFAQLDHWSNRFANCLTRLGFNKGDIVFTFLPKMPEQFIAFLGILKIQAIVGTLFANFGDEALLDRLMNACCVVTKKSMLKKIKKIMSRLACLKAIIVVDLEEHIEPNIFSFKRLMEQEAEDYQAEITPKDIYSILHFTSGSTGKPKGVLHVHGSILSQSMTAEKILQLNEEEVFWCTADQGWVTGTSYGIIAPWSLGVTQIQYSGSYDPLAWFTILEKEKVTIWYTAPTALRMLMREEAAFFKQFDLSALKYIFSVGEPLNPEILVWSRKVLGRDIYDTWFQTETGSIMIANRPGMAIKPGSMGKPAEGIHAAIISEDGVRQAANVPGNLCLQPGWPSMFVTYLGNEQVYAQKFRYGYYFTGDTAFMDEEGYYWFLGRSDDVINTAGHLVSPFEVESSLLEIDEVAESGVIGAFDEILFEKVVAFIVLANGCTWSPELELKVRLHVTNRVSSIACPQEIRIVDALPKNKSGKIMRRVLKSVYLGQDPGDLSTMEI